MVERVTISMDKKLLEELRRLAKSEGLSLSKLVSRSLVLFELKRLFHKLGRIPEWNDVREAIILNCEVVPVDVGVAEEGASISHGTGLPAVDALIYTSIRRADKFYTTDGSFEVLKRKKPRIIFL